MLFALHPDHRVFSLICSSRSARRTCLVPAFLRFKQWSRNGFTERELTAAAAALWLQLAVTGALWFPAGQAHPKRAPTVSSIGWCNCCIIERAGAAEIKAPYIPPFILGGHTHLSSVVVPNALSLYHYT